MADFNGIINTTIFGANSGPALYVSTVDFYIMFFFWLDTNFKIMNAKKFIDILSIKCLLF